MPTGLIAILILTLVIVGAITTRRCTEFLLLGSLLGAIVLYKTHVLTEWILIIQNVVAENAWLWLIVGLFGSLIALLQASKGTFGFSKVVEKICTNERRTMLTAYIMGILIFVDDYLNVLTIGVCMKDVYDRRKLPRESLAFILNSTGAPVCVLLPVSSWAVFFGSLFYNEEIISSQFSSAMDAYIHAIPFCFYPIVALIVVCLFCLGVMPKLGPMKKAFDRVKETGKLYSDASKKYNCEVPGNQEKDGNIWFFLIPMLVLTVIGIATTDILLAVFAALFVCLFLYVPIKRLMNVETFFTHVMEGFGSMLSMLFMLVAAFSLKEICMRMGLTEYLIDFARPFLSPHLFPMITFLLLGALAFVTGSNWGMSAVVTPILLPICAAIGANPVLTMAAIISGGTFGSHACFYTDATILTARSAGIETIEHALTQFPYVAIATVLSIAGYLVAGYLM